MKYLAHIADDRAQTIKEHLAGTAQRAKGFAEQFGKGEWGYCCGMLHDIGKYSAEFQRRIRGEQNIFVDHSTAGARVCREKGGLYAFMEYCIAGHHAGLPDYGNEQDSGTSPTLSGRRQKKIKDYQMYKEEIEIPALTSMPFDLTKTENPDFSLSVFIRMLYSCLVDADFLDTEEFMKNGAVERDCGESIETLLAKLEQYIEGWLRNQDSETVNGRRSEILRHCLECGKKERGLFRLTVPTGGGKTIASLAFALRHAAEHHMERVIYVIPYTSIIEQNAKVFREILGEQNVLENHCNVDYTSTEELIPMQLASENWDKPVIVTTNVQFFESLFANKSSKCRKLHNIANSVVIFDEAQMLPNDYLKPCIAMMEELIRFYRASLVLCTATQPVLDAFFQSKRKATELCPRMHEQFRFFKRVSYEDIGTLDEETLTGCLDREFQALCIVNTRKSAQSIYSQLQGEGVYHLSTSMYPLHRRRVLNEIRRRIEEEKRCVVISTSLVEAGVDLDFQTVYRELAGVDSMIQAAGRCNREGKRSAKDSRVLIFQLEGAGRVAAQRQQIDAAKIVLEDEEDIDSLESIQRYFEGLYHFRGESLDKKKIMEQFRDKRYSFAKVAKDFRLIEENTTTIFIQQEEEAAQLLQRMKYQGFTKDGMRRAGQYSIQVYEGELEKLHGSGKIIPVSEDIKDFYVLTDGEQYSEETGLNLQIEDGMALFW